MKRLNLGCGDDIREGFVNLDIIPGKGVDVVHDINKTPWPFEDEAFDAVLARHVLEHVPHGPDGRGFLRVMEELHRILKPLGFLAVEGPHWEDEDATWGDPTHTRSVRPRTFEHFTGALPAYGSTARFRLLKTSTSAVRPRYPGVPVLWRLTRPCEARFQLVKVGR